MSADLVKKIVDLGPCCRCGRGIFREKLPITGLVKLYVADTQSVVDASRALAGGAGLGLSAELIGATMPVDIEFRYEKARYENGGDLCQRCVLGLIAFLDGLTEEETAEYDEIDKLMS